MDLPLTLLADQTILDASGLTINGEIDLNGHQATFDTVTWGVSAVLNGVVSGAGEVVKQDGGTLVLAGANTYTGPTRFSRGRDGYGGYLVLRNNRALGAADGTAATGTTLGTGAFLILESGIAVSGELLTIDQRGTFSGSGANSSTWNGDIVRNNSDAADCSLYGGLSVGGQIRGSGGLKPEYGTFVFSGDSTYSGETRLDTRESVLVVNGTQANSRITISYPEPSPGYPGSVLAGVGTVGAVNAGGMGGSVAPGPVGGVGVLHSGSVGLGGRLVVDIAGDSAGQAVDGYDQLRVAGTVTLGGVLAVSFPGGFTPLIGQPFTIIDNDGSDPISGTFQGLPEGGLLVVDNVVFQVGYTGGDGNDVVLTVVSAHSPRAGVAGQIYDDRNQNGVKDPTEPGFAGWTVTLTGMDSGGNPVSLSTVTTPDDPWTPGVDETGRYWMSVAGAGTYTIAEVVQTGWKPTAPADGRYTRTLAAGHLVQGLDFGNTGNCLSTALAAFHGPDLTGKDGPRSKLGLDLANLSCEYSAYQARGDGTDFQPGNPLLAVDGGQVRIDAVADTDSAGTVSDSTVQGMTADLTALGMIVSETFERIAEGSLPIEELPELAALSSVAFVKPVYRPVTNAGLITSQGDTAMRSDPARTAFGVTGQGVKVGVLSDSVFENPPYSLIDLPPNVQVLQGFPGGTDEGRAMLEILHDIAPDADGAFATAEGGQLAFRHNILALAAAGANVIVDDVIYADEPMFVDGPVAQAVDQVVAGGAAYFSSAGNSDRKSYENWAPVFNGTSQLLEFNSLPLDEYQQVTVPVGTEIILSFQWDQPFASLGCPVGAETDLDILLYDNTSTPAQIPLSTSPYLYTNTLAQNIGQDPLEILEFFNDGSIDADGDLTPDTQFNLAIQLVGGPAPSLIKYVDITGRLQIDEYDTQSPTTFGHANAAGAIAVGAADYQYYPGNSAGNTPALESFSSSGGVPILFNTAGSVCCGRLPAPVVRKTPGVVAPDGVDTTFFGMPDPSGTGPFEQNDFPNFFGT